MNKYSSILLHLLRKDKTVQAYIKNELKKEVWDKCIYEVTDKFKKYENATYTNSISNTILYNSTVVLTLNGSVVNCSFINSSDISPVVMALQDSIILDDLE